MCCVSLVKKTLPGLARGVKAFREISSFFSAPVGIDTHVLEKYKPALRSAEH
jgi:hypothetical protein